ERAIHFLAALHSCPFAAGTAAKSCPRAASAPASGCARQVRRWLPPTNRGGHLNQPNELSAQEWGKQQAARSPRWSEEKWQRIATVLGVCVARETPPDGTSGSDAA